MHILLPRSLLWRPYAVKAALGTSGSSNQTPCRPRWTHAQPPLALMSASVPRRTRGHRHSTRRAPAPTPVPPAYRPAFHTIPPSLPLTHLMAPPGALPRHRPACQPVHLPPHVHFPPHVHPSPSAAPSSCLRLCNIPPPSPFLASAPAHHAPRTTV